MGGCLNKKILNPANIKHIFFISFCSIYLVNLITMSKKAQPTINTFDTPSYFNFTLYPSFRMQIVTAIYSIVEEYEKIIQIQVFLAGLSWVFLSLTLYKFFDESLVALLITPLILFFASSSVVLEHNYILASESLNNSGINFFIGSLLLLLKKYSTFNTLLVFTSLGIVAGTKSASALATLLIGLILLFWISFHQSKKKRRLITFAVLGNFILVFFVATALSSDITKTLTTSGTLNNRIWINPEWRDQVIQSGYPVELRKLWIDYSESNLGSPPDQAVVDTPSFVDWWETGGESFLNRFMIKNLDYTILGPICLPCLNSNFTFNQTLVAGWGKGTEEFRYYETLQGISAPKTFFWPIKPEDSYFVLGVFSSLIALSLLLSILSQTPLSASLRKMYLVMLTYVFAYSYLSWWFGSKPVDMTRHQLAGAITIRILAIIAFGHLLFVLYELVKKLLSKKIRVGF